MTDPHELIEQYLPLARSIALQEWRKAPHALELDEIRSIAHFGLVGAAMRWHPYCAEKGYSPDALEFFKPFVVLRVKGAIVDAVRSADRASRALRDRYKLIRDAGQDQGATDSQLAERTGLSELEIRHTIRDMAHRHTVSLEAEEYEPQAQTDVESSVLAGDILSAVVAVIKTLTDEQQAIVALHYHRGLQLQQVARALGITESRASQLHARAVLTIKAAMREAAEQWET